MKVSKRGRPYYRAKYRNELIEEVTGKKIRAVQMMMRRKGWSLKEYLIYLYEGCQS
jgi:hypothetical protein